MPRHLDHRLLSYATSVPLDQLTAEQAIRTSQMPFIYPHMVLMPDAHLGKGATVGSVIPSLGAIMPAAVGVDIGCGMIACLTDLSVAEIHSEKDWNLTELRKLIEQEIPLNGMNGRLWYPHTEKRIAELEKAAGEIGLNPDVFSNKWRMQVGSLGSGNHFIEVTADEEGRVWAFLHSGSRGIGFAIASYHIAVAKEYMLRHWISLPDPDLAYLVEGTSQFDRYIAEMRWAMRYAYLNREEMMDRLIHAVRVWAGRDVHVLQTINTHHNYSRQEHHFGKDVWISRKGAIDASEDAWGLIPGSMGTASYIVRGKGCREALFSAPHGAGRSHSRRSARARFTYEQLQVAMQGIEWRDSEAFLDEHPAAYKDIDQVIADSSDLIEVVHTLHQLVNVKGA